MQNDKVAEEKLSDEEQTNNNSASGVTADPENNIKQEGSETSSAALDKLQAELFEQKDKYLRLYSDFENFRRRSSKEKLDFLRSATEEVIVSLLPVVDDFERAISANEKNKDDSTFVEGVKLIHNKLYKTLEQKGLKPIQAKGQVFDVELHEAITQIPAPEESLKGKVIDEVEKGYYLNDKVIRFAKVVIGS